MTDDRDRSDHIVVTYEPRGRAPRRSVFEPWDGVEGDYLRREETRSRGAWREIGSEHVDNVTVEQPADRAAGESVIAAFSPLELDCLRAVGLAGAGATPGPAVLDALGGLRASFSESTARFTLSGLAADGYIEKGAADGRTNTYDLTDRGRDTLAALRATTTAALQETDSA